MALKMTQPTKHQKSGTYRVRLHIPAELRDTAERLYGVRTQFLANLGTKDPKEAKRLAPDALAGLQTKLDNVKTAHAGQGRRLSEREVRALAGEVYAAEVRRHEDDPGSQDWHAVQTAIMGQADEGEDRV